jgi:hypothetical protein
VLLGVMRLHGLEKAGDAGHRRHQSEQAEGEQRHQHHDRRLDGVMGGIAARFAEEGDHEEAGHVEGGQHGGADADPEQRAAALDFEGDAEDGLLAPEAAGLVEHLG